MHLKLAGLLCRNDCNTCMRLLKTWFWMLPVCLCGVLLLAGCASGSKSKWLQFFFDGAPGSPVESKQARKFDKVDLPPIWLDPPRLEPGSNERPLTIHQPYAERRCVECHASNFSQTLKGDVSGLCSACHKGFLTKTKFIHAPVSDGQCTVCHFPHQGREPHLLVKPIRELCFDCHKEEYVMSIKACSETPGRICTECHDPHMEDRKFRLVPPGQSGPVRKMTPEK